MKPVVPHSDWVLRPLSPEQEALQQQLAQRLDLPPLITRLLVTRNIKDETEAQQFLEGGLKDLPNPFLLHDMDKAVLRLMQAREKKEKILFFGDYDVDGITGTAQLQAYFREIGLKTRTLLPHRMNDGYGLTDKSVQRILGEKPQLLVTIDNGTKAFKEISFLKSHGIDVIVVDHHETPQADQYPPVVALINPKKENSAFPEKNIASAGLVFLLLMAFRSRCREKGLGPFPNLKRYLDLACLGTIADIVPLVGTNRLLVKFGLEEITNSSRPGIKLLKEFGGVPSPTNTGHVSFRLAPRINAAGRLSDPHLALDLLLSQDETEARALAEKLESFNQQRQLMEQKVVEEAIALVERDQKDRKGIVVAAADWHLGVVGIVASKLVERFGRPAIVLSISEDGREAKGSARTIPGLSVHAALKKIEEEMTRFGGHDAAAGMSLLTSNLENFSQRFDESIKELWKEGPAKLWVDAELSLKEINSALIRKLSLLEPHGPGNPEPVFMTRDVNLSTSRIVGKKHLKTILVQAGAQMEAIGFNQGDYLETALKNKQHRITFFPQLNEWNGVQNVQIKIKNIVPSS